MINKSFMRWPGNKSKYIKYIIPHLPNKYSCYIEPFVGSGSLFFNIQPKKWVINDFNKDLMNVYKVVRDNPKNLINRIKHFADSTNFENIDRKDKLIESRKYVKGFESLPYNIKRASIFIIAKFVAFMGYVIVKDKFGIPSLDIGIAYKTNPIYLFSQKYFDLILNISIFLNNDNKQNIIANEDYKIIFKKAKRDDFVFIDPPYQEEHNYQFNYNKDENLSNFNEELLSQVRKLDKKSVKWLMTQADTKLVRSLFKDYEIISFKVYRRSSKAFKNELIIKNY
jgi:DNA adenine methylase